MPSSGVSCLARDAAAPDVRRNLHGAGQSLATAVLSRDGTASPLPCRRRLLPRREPRERPRADRARRRGPDRLLPHSPADRAALRLADARALPDGQPLPPPGRDAGGEPRPGNEGPQRGLCPRLQRAPPTQGPRLRAPLLVESDRIGGAVRGDGRVHRRQSAPPRLRPPARGMALDVRACSPSDRFGRCPTTPTS